VSLIQFFTLVLNIKDHSLSMNKVAALTSHVCIFELLILIEMDLVIQDIMKLRMTATWLQLGVQEGVVAHIPK